ncbi:MAG: response regulator, partial [Cyanobacteria bacterium P01_E01_bin.35]
MSEEKFSILLVDDDEVDRLTVKRAFKEANFPASLIEAINGEDAISKLLLPISNSSSEFDQQEVAGAKFQEANNNPVKFLETNHNNFDLVLLDYHLPDIDGLNLIAEIKALNLDLPLIVLTGQGDEELAVEMMKAGAA